MLESWKVGSRERVKMRTAEVPDAPLPLVRTGQGGQLVRGGRDNKRDIGNALPKALPHCLELDLDHVQHSCDVLMIGCAMPSGSIGLRMISASWVDRHR